MLEARASAWRDGDLRYLLHRGVKHGGQRAWVAKHKSGRERKRSVWCVARRVGKSWALVVLAFETCLQTPRARVPYAAATAKSLAEFVVPIVTELIEHAPTELRPELVGLEVRFPNGSKIIMQGCEDRAKADRLRGPFAHRVIVDEAGFIPVLQYVVESVLLFQLATTGGDMIIASSPPETPAHTFTRYAVEAEARGDYVHADITEAPHLSAEVIADLCDKAGGAGSATWQREGLAKVVVDPKRALVPEFTAVRDVIVREHVSGPYVDRYVVGDGGWNDLFVVLYAEFDFLTGLVFVTDEDAFERTTSAEVQHVVNAHERELWGDAPVYRRVLDASAITRADMTRLMDEDDPTAESRWRAARNDDRTAAVNALRITVGRKRIVIHPRCKTLCSHMGGGIWNEQRTDFARPAGTDKDGVTLGHFDGVAACMYLERHVDRNHNPAPPEPYDLANQWVPLEKRVPTSEVARRANAWQRAMRPQRQRR